ncbi:MAG: hypothetical protein IPF70_08620 [Saprospiraceae bacterium]|nr:hypothetical protein [Saprospiraceae bacterium]
MKRSAVDLPFRRRGGGSKQDNNNGNGIRSGLNSPSGLPAVGMGSGGERKHDNNNHW